MTPILQLIAKRLTAAICMALVLVGVVVSGHAKAIHPTGPITTLDQPCHHAMSPTAASDGPTVLDLCRDLCLNKVPDHAVTANVVTLAAPRVTTEFAYVALLPAVIHGLASKTDDQFYALGDPPPRRPQPALHQRLLI